MEISYTVSHIACIISKSIGIIARLRHFVPSNTLINIYSTSLQFYRAFRIWYCYIVSVKVQFFCLPIGQQLQTISRAGPQNRIMCRSTKHHVWQPVHNETFIDRSIIKWVQYACVSTMKFQSPFFKLFIKHLRRSIYTVLVSN